MAISPIEALNKVVEDRIAYTSLIQFPFLNSLYERGRMKTKTDTNINWDAEVSLGAAAIESVNADGANTATGDTVPANLRIGNYRVKHQFSVNKVALAEAATRAPGELADLFRSHVDRGLITIFRTLNGLLFTGDGTAASGEVIGINKMLDNTYSYGGINPVTYPNWKAVLLANNGTARALSKNLMLDFDEQVKLRETAYNMIVTHPTTAKKYNQVFDSAAGGAALAQVVEANGVKRVELGAGSRTYNGIPILEDPAAPNGSIVFMLDSDIDLFTFRVANNPTPQSMSQWEVVGTEAYGMNINIAELPSMNSAKRTFEIYVLPQIRLFNRRSLQAVQDIAVA